ncbi:MAG: transglutaminase domain-containing protein [Methanomicrobiales archaeon]
MPDFKVHILNFERGGGIIKRHSIFALLFALGIVMLAVPSSVIGMDSDNTQENAKIELNKEEIQKVSAASYKKVYYKKYYKKWYKSYGRWKYYWKSYWTYKYVKKSSSSVSASSSYSSTSSSYKVSSTTTSSSSKYKKVRYKKYYKKWYKSYGRWKYYWKSYWTYKYVKKSSSSVSAASSSSSNKVSTSSSSSGSVSTSGLKSVASDMNKKYNHRSGSSTTAAGVRRTGYGDCWGLADLAAQELKKKGYKVRVVQGASRDSYRHRWVQYSANGKWNTFESTMITKRFGSKHYSYAIASVRTVIKYY